MYSASRQRRESACVGASAERGDIWISAYGLFRYLNVNSVFGYYVGGQKGQTLAMDYSVLF